MSKYKSEMLKTNEIEVFFKEGTEDQLLKDYQETISPNADIEDIVKHIHYNLDYIHEYPHMECFIEGVGPIHFLADNKKPEKSWDVWYTVDSRSVFDFDVEEI